MGDMAEGWNIIKEERQKYKDGNRETFRKGILDVLRESYDVKQITEYQFRINEVLDIYPSNRKWHLLTKNKRGQFRREYDVTDVKAVLKEEL